MVLMRPEANPPLSAGYGLPGNRSSFENWALLTHFPNRNPHVTNGSIPSRTLAVQYPSNA